MRPQATLFHPFRTGAVPMPDGGSRALLLGAEPGLETPDGFDAELFLVQGFRPSFLALQREGWQVAPVGSGEDFDLALVLCGRHRGENEARLAEAIRRVKPGGLVMVAGDGTSGAAALRRRLAAKEDPLADAIAGREPGSIAVEGGEGMPPPRLYASRMEPVAIDGHLSKHHGTVFWLRRSEEADAFASMVEKVRSGWPPGEGGFVAAPGMFSFDRADPGSKLLAGHLPADLGGRVADFGAGWGYLAVEAAKRCPGVGSIDLFEADWASLEAAKANWARLGGGKPAGFFWLDLLTEAVEGCYDAVVMNPPFHQGRQAQPALGQGMIAAAAKAVRKGGRLFLVANRGLPYEAALEGAFASVSELARDKGFKVLAARR